MAILCLQKSLPRKVQRADKNDYSVKLVRLFLKPIGVWPRSEKLKKEHFLTYFVIVTCFTIILCPMIPCVMHIILEEEIGLFKIRAIGPASFWLMASVKYCLLIFHEKDIKKCLQHIKNDWSRIERMRDQQIMLKSAKFGRYMVSFCLICMHSGMFIYDTARWFTTIVSFIGNETVICRVLPLPFYSGIVDTRFSPAYEIVFVLQCISSFVVNSVTAGACSLAAVFIMHACGQLTIVMTWLNDLVEELPDFRRKQANIIKHHLRVLRFMSLVEDIMNQICFVEVLGSTFNICLLGYCFITELEQDERTDFIAYPIIFTSITFNIFIFCYIGEIISEQCKQVGETAYMIEWYRLPEKDALGVILIISRSRLVIKITAGKIIELSLATFGSVIKTSVTYLNMLKQIMQ